MGPSLHCSSGSSPEGSMETSLPLLSRPLPGTRTGPLNWVMTINKFCLLSPNLHNRRHCLRKTLLHRWPHFPPSTRA